MKNTTVLYAGLLFTIAITLVISCQKEVNFPVSTSPFISGWSFTHSNTDYEGCVTSADYETANGMKLVSIEGVDASSSFISIKIPAPDGKLNAGATYTAAQGAALIVEDKNGNTYRSNSAASSFSFQTSAVTDSSIIGSFKGSLNDASNTGYAISNGHVTALLGRANTCRSSGNTNGTAGFSLISSSTSCSDVSVEGTYNKSTTLTSANKVSIKVNVSTIGTWSLTTPTVNGMKFSGNGSFTTTGVQSIVLTGSGTPETADNTAFPIVGTTTTCTFYILVTA
ncbi:MAG: hypothetical protein ACXVLT_01285 [Flavisolibacter sp.]